MDEPVLSIVVAIAQNNVIGFDGDMPWKLSSDLKRFKQITLGKPVIMGRKTFQSIGRPLPQRLNIVVTRSGFSHEGVEVAGSLSAAIEIARNWATKNQCEEICIIGGGEIYAQALDPKAPDQCDRLYVTHVLATPEGDTLFPPIKDEHWQLVSREEIPVGEKDDVATLFAIYQRAS